MVKKGKIVNSLLIVFLVFSMLSIVAIASQSCFVYAESVQPNVTRVQIHAGGDVRTTNVTGEFKNNEAVDVYGVATAVVTLSAKAGDSQTKSSGRTLISPGQTEWITLSFDLPFEPYYACMITFAAEPIAGSGGTGTGNQPTSPSSGGAGHTSGNNAGKGFDYASVAFPVVGIVVVALGSIGGFMMLKKTRISEQKVRLFSSYEYQDWVFQRLRGHAGSVLDSRKGIDGFTGDNVPVAIKQSDSVDRLQVDGFMNALTQAKTRSGVMVAFGFNSEAYAAVSRARMNRIDIKLITAKELIDHKDTIL